MKGAKKIKSYIRSLHGFEESYRHLVHNPVVSKTDEKSTALTKDFMNVLPRDDALMVV